MLEVLGKQPGGVGVKLKCQCDCGKITTPAARNVINLTTKSCGCILKESIQKRFPSLEDRLNKYIDKSSGRWIWKGYKNVGGYGRICVNGKMVLVHRLIYELNIGPIPKGLLICHKNDIPEDVTPENLFCGTHQDNHDDMIKKGRQSHNPGIKSANHKMTDSKIRAIRILYENGDYTQFDLSNMFEIDRTTISQIINRKTWRHI